MLPLTTSPRVSPCTQPAQQSQHAACRQSAAVSDRKTRSWFDRSWLWGFCTVWLVCRKRMWWGRIRLCSWLMWMGFSGLCLHMKSSPPVPPPQAWRGQDRDTHPPQWCVQLHDGGGFSRAQSAGEVTPRSKEGRLMTLPTPNWVCSIIFHVDWCCDN